MENTEAVLAVKSQNTTVNYGSRCHGDQCYNPEALPDQTRTYLDGF